MENLYFPNKTNILFEKLISVILSFKLLTSFLPVNAALFSANVQYFMSIGKGRLKMFFPHKILDFPFNLLTIFKKQGGGIKNIPHFNENLLEQKP